MNKEVQPLPPPPTSVSKVRAIFTVERVPPLQCSIMHRARVAGENIIAIDQKEAATEIPHPAPPTTTTTQ